MRKSALELAGLPVPGDDVLELPAEEYQTRFTAAQDNIAKLAAKGLKLGGKGAGCVKTDGLDDRHGIRGAAHQSGRVDPDFEGRRHA